MIAKKVVAPKGGGRAAALVRYVVDAKGQVDPRSWTATADYILDATVPPNAEGEKVSAVRVTNCLSDDPAGATMEIEATQAIYRGRSQAPKTYHLIFSFPHGERPGEATLREIEDELCGAIGLGNHQRVSAVHIDRDHYHVHVAINTVTPDGKRVIEPYQEMPRLMQTCERMEIKHGLQRTNHGLEKEPTSERTREQEPSSALDHSTGSRIESRDPGVRDTRFRRYLRECHDSIVAGWGNETGNGLHNLPGRNVVSDDTRSAVLVLDDAAGLVVEGPASNADSVRWAGAGDGGSVGPAGGGAVAVEARTGVETLAGYVAREIAPALRDALTWQEVHDALAAHGLVVKTRGAGLVIGDPELELWCKASAVARDFSLSGLEGALGPFAASMAGRSAATRGGARGEGAPSYQPRPIALGSGTSQKLYARYQAERDAAAKRRTVGLEAVRRDYQRDRQKIDAWTASQRVAMRMAQKGQRRRVAGQTTTGQARAARAAAGETAAKARASVIAGTRVLAWNAWLAREAEQGDEDALSVLRDRESRSARSLGSLFAPDREQRTAERLLLDLRPEVRPNGSVVYRATDGGAVVDRGRSLTMDRNTPGACLVALQVMEAKFPGQALVLDGTAAMAQTIAALAGTRGAGVQFADPTLEAIRTGARHATITATPERTQSWIDSWLDQTSKKRERLSPISDERLWTPGDAGEAAFAGLRVMSDGKCMIVLNCGDQTLVKPVTDQEAGRAASWSIGQIITTDAAGDVTSRKNGRSR